MPQLKKFQKKFQKISKNFKKFGKNFPFETFSNSNNPYHPAQL